MKTLNENLREVLYYLNAQSLEILPENSDFDFEVKAGEIDKLIHDFEERFNKVRIAYYSKGK